MRTMLIAAALLLPTAGFAQTAVPADAPAPSKINTAIRADVAARGTTASDAPATVGDVRVRTARMGEKTVDLHNGALQKDGPQNGSTPEARASAGSNAG